MNENRQPRLVAGDMYEVGSIVMNEGVTGSTPNVWHTKPREFAGYINDRAYFKYYANDGQPSLVTYLYWRTPRKKVWLVLNATNSTVWTTLYPSEQKARAALPPNSTRGNYDYKIITSEWEE